MIKLDKHIAITVKAKFKKKYLSITEKKKIKPWFLIWYICNIRPGKKCFR